VGCSRPLSTGGDVGAKTARSESLSGATRMNSCAGISTSQGSGPRPDRRRDGRYVTAPTFLSWCYALLEWTNERLNPSWKESAADRRDRRRSELLEWRRRIMWFLAKAALLLPAAEVHERILTRIFEHDDETAAS
jgi:hypothetical protein